MTGKLVLCGVLLVAPQVAFALWGPGPVLTAWLPRLFVAIVLVVAAMTVARTARERIGRGLNSFPYGGLLARSVSVVIVALGVIAALDHVRIATSVTRPVLITVLATVAGVVVVGVGGGLIRPMQGRWEAWLERATAESSTVRERARAEPDETQLIPRPAGHEEAGHDKTVVIHTSAEDAERTQVIPANDRPVARPQPRESAHDEETARE